MQASKRNPFANSNLRLRRRRGRVQSTPQANTGIKLIHGRRLAQCQKGVRQTTLDPMLLDLIFSKVCLNLIAFIANICRFVACPSSSTQVRGRGVLENNSVSMCLDVDMIGRGSRRVHLGLADTDSKHSPCHHSSMRIRADSPITRPFVGCHLSSFS